MENSEAYILALSVPFIIGAVLLWRGMLIRLGERQRQRDEIEQRKLRDL